MRVRALLWLTAIVSSIVGGVAVYVALTVPNDLRADALLKQAKREMAAGKDADARATLAKVVQQYPRTDGAAAATVALVAIGEQERGELQRAVVQLRRQTNQQTLLLDQLQKAVLDVKNAPPKVVTITQPAPPLAPAPKPAPAKKTAPPKKKSTRKRR
ncbi:MAG: hypothetical protein JO197_03985 [Acidobacteria bacterium]|nr:hypothetical protein [Acidobacteriota bacterium]MBV9476454.1 hypothetical protein [Acidobacteriota bacterium]